MSVYSEDRLTVTVRVEVANDPTRWARLELRLASDRDQPRLLNADYASPYGIEEVDGPAATVDAGYSRRAMGAILLSGIFYAFRCAKRDPNEARFEVRSVEGRLRSLDGVALAEASSHAALELLGLDRACLKAPDPFRVVELSTRGERPRDERLP